MEKWKLEFLGEEMDEGGVLEWCVQETTINRSETTEYLFQIKHSYKIKITVSILPKNYK